MIEKLIIIAILIVLIVEDFKYRYVHFLALKVLAVAILLFSYLHYFDAWSITFNLGFLAFLGLVLFGYVRFVKRSSLSESLGKGDILFVSICALYLNSFSFLLWINLGFIFSLLMHFALNRTFLYQKHNTVPLIGYLGMLLVPIILLSS